MPKKLSFHLPQDLISLQGVIIYAAAVFSERFPKEEKEHGNEKVRELQATQHIHEVEVFPLCSKA